MIDSSLYHGFNDPESVEMIDALIISHSDERFGDYVTDDSWWPTGVQYSIAPGAEHGQLSVSIKVFVDLTTTDDPVEDLQGYIDYLTDLQIDLLCRFNKAKGLSE